MEVVIVTGMSGAGKTKIKAYFEDKGYYAIDNLPPSLVGDFIGLCHTNERNIDRLCLVMDLRGREFFSEFEGALEDLRENKEVKLKLLFAEASSESLIRRYSEVRRSHPLSAAGLSISDAINKEKELLKPIRDVSDYIIDTSRIKVPELNSALDKILNRRGKKKNFTINILSFGYKNGIPAEADWVVDTRFIPNPFYVPELKKLTGNDKEVSDFVLSKSITKKFLKETSDLIDELINHYIKEGKYSLTIAVGCTGGQHRSVAVANKLYEKFSKDGRVTTLEHRDI